MNTLGKNRWGPETKFLRISGWLDFCVLTQDYKGAEERIVRGENKKERNEREEGWREGEREIEGQAKVSRRSHTKSHLASLLRNPLMFKERKMRPYIMVRNARATF